MQRLLELPGPPRAVGYLHHSGVSSIAGFANALRRAARGDVIVDAAVIEDLAAVRPLYDPLNALTPAERHVLALIAEGRTNAQIARYLGRAEAEIDRQVGRIASRFGITKDAPDRMAEDVRLLAALAALRPGPEATG